MKRFGFWPCAVAGILLCASEPSLAYYHPTAGRWVARDPIPYADGLYQYVKVNPSRYADPAGLAAIAVDGNRYGKWDIDQQSKDVGVKDPRFGGSDPFNAGRGLSITHIQFHPNPDTVCCDDIRFLQTVRTTDVQTGEAYDGQVTGAANSAAKGEGGYAIDNANRRSPWYGINDEGKPDEYYPHPDPGWPTKPGATMGKPEYYVVPGSAPNPLKDAELNDWPGTGRRGTKFEAETCAVCYSGKDKGLVYHCLRWAMQVGADGKVTSPTPSGAEAGPSFKSAVGAWNKQATGPDNKRTTPNQEPIPALRYGAP